MNTVYWAIIELFKVIIKNEVNEFLVKLIHNRVKKYKHRKTIGKGTFGKVKKGRHILSGEPVAIKVLEKGKIKDITDVQRVARELHILKLVRHSAIAQLYEVIESQDRIFIVMEYAQNGEFFDYIMDGRVYRCGYSGGVNRRRTTTSRKLFPDWSIFIAQELRIATLNQKTCSWMYKIGSKQSISDCQICIKMGSIY